MTNEKVLNLLTDSKISEKTAGEKEEFTLGQRAADAIAKFADSWRFIFAFTGVLILWMIVSTLLHIAAYRDIPVVYTLVWLTTERKRSAGTRHSGNVQSKRQGVAIRILIGKSFIPCINEIPKFL